MMHQPQPFELVDAVGSGLRHGTGFLDDIPELITRIVDEDIWQHWETRRGQVVEPVTFEEFVVTAPTAGLGSSVDTLERVCRDDTRALDAITRATRRPVGTNQHGEGRANGPTQLAGNGTQKALRRLRKDRPDLHAEVLAERLSSNAAMLQAGFRHATATVRLDSAESAAQTLARKASPEFLDALTRLLTKESA